MSLTKKLLVVVLVLACLCSVFVDAARAVEFDKDGIIGPQETIEDDVFLDADTIVVDGTVHGVVFANANTVTINGTINGDLLVFSAKTQINGVVNGNVAFVGQTLKVSGTVNGTLFGLGGAVWLKPGASIQRNLFFTGYALEAEAGSQVGTDISINSRQARLAGKVGRNVIGSTHGLQVEGLVGHNIDVMVDKPGLKEYFVLPGFELPPPIESGIRILDGGRVDGMILYTSPVKQHETLQGMPADRIAFEQASADANPLEDLSPQQRAGLWFKDRLRALVTLVVLGGLAWWLWPKAMERAASQAAHPLPALGWGLLTSVGGIAAVLLAFVTIWVVGILMGVVTLGGLATAIFFVGLSGWGLASSSFGLVLIYGSKLVIASAVGLWLCGKALPKLCLHSFWALVVGVILYVFVEGLLSLALPGVGVLFDLLVTFLGMGACWLAWRASHAPQVTPIPPAPDPAPSLPA